MASKDPNSKLLDKVDNLSISGVKQASKEGADINYVDELGNFALLLASDRDYKLKVSL